MRRVRLVLVPLPAGASHISCLAVRAHYVTLSYPLRDLVEYMQMLPGQGEHEN